MGEKIQTNQPQQILKLEKNRSVRCIITGCASEAAATKYQKSKNLEKLNSETEKLIQCHRFYCMRLSPGFQHLLLIEAV